MKQFGLLVLAAILGSTITYFTIQWTGLSPSNVKIEHIEGAPIHNVGYSVNERGEMVPLDFTGTAEKVTKAVVHIRSTTAGSIVQRDPRDKSSDPWQFFFGPQGPAERGPS